MHDPPPGGGTCPNRRAGGLRTPSDAITGRGYRTGSRRVRIGAWHPRRHRRAATPVLPIRRPPPHDTHRRMRPRWAAPTSRAATVAAMREPARAHTSTKHAAGAGAPSALEVFVQILGRWIVFVVCVAAVISLIVRIIVIASLDSSVMEDLDLFTAVGRFDGFVWFAAYGAAVGFVSGLLVSGVAAVVLARWPGRRRATRFAQCASAVFVGGLLTLSVSTGAGPGLHRVGSDARPATDRCAVHRRRFGCRCRDEPGVARWLVRATAPPAMTPAPATKHSRRPRQRRMAPRQSAWLAPNPAFGGTPPRCAC